LELEKIPFDKEIIIIGTYPDTQKEKSLTKQCIESFSGLGRKIMLVSHYTCIRRDTSNGGLLYL